MSVSKIIVLTVEIEVLSDNELDDETTIKVIDNMEWGFKSKTEGIEIVNSTLEDYDVRNEEDEENG